MTGCLNDCNDHGICNSDHECACYTFYRGDDCDIRWRSDDKWFAAWNTFIALVLLGQMLLFGMCSRYIIRNRHKMKSVSLKNWPISVHIMILGAIGSLMRIIVFAIDPYSERGVMPPAASWTLFTVPVVLGECVVFMLFLYWFEVGQKKGVHFPQTVKKLRPLLIGLCLFAACAVLPIYITGNVLLNPLLQSLGNLFIAAMLFVVLGILVLAGIRLIIKLDALRVTSPVPISLSSSSDGLMVIDESPPEDVITTFTFRVRWYLVVIGTSILLIVGTLLLYVLTDSRFKEWPYLIFQFILRVLEFMYTFPTLVLLVQRKKPSNPKSLKDSSNML